MTWQMGVFESTGGGGAGNTIRLGSRPGSLLSQVERTLGAPPDLLIYSGLNPVC